MRRSRPLVQAAIALFLSATASVAGQQWGCYFDWATVGPPPSPGEVLVERLMRLGAEPSAAESLRVQIDVARSHSLARVDAVAVIALDLPGDETAKAMDLAEAYAAGQSVTLAGVPPGSPLALRAVSLQAAGMEPETAAQQAVSAMRAEALDDGLGAVASSAELASRRDGRRVAPPAVLPPSLNGFCRTCPSIDAQPTAPATTWRTWSSTITSGSCKLIRFALTAGKRYRFTFCEGGGSASFDTRLRGMNTVCALVADDDDKCGIQAQIEITALVTGWHYVEITGSGGGSGAFTLAYREETALPAATCPTCPRYSTPARTPTLAWQTVGGTVPENGCRVIRIPVLVSRYYQFTFCDGGGTANFDTTLELRRGNCTQQDYNDDCCGLLSELIPWSNSSQYFYLIVSGYGGQGGDFTLAYREFPGWGRK